MQRRAPLRTFVQSNPDVAKLQRAVEDALRPIQNDKRYANYKHPRAADAAAGTTTPETVLFHFDDDERLTELLFIPSAAVAKDAVNYATFTFRLRDGDGGSAKVIVTYSTSSGAMLAWRPHKFAVSPEAPTAGVLTVEISKAAGGVVIPSGMFRAQTVEVAL